mgnify:CR=1 FL=1
MVFGRRAEFADVGDINEVAGETHRFEDLVELGSGGADEGFALEFVMIAGGFSDEHEVGLRISAGEDEGFAQSAKSAGRRPGGGGLLKGGDLLFRGVAGGADPGGDVWRR